MAGLNVVPLLYGADGRPTVSAQAAALRQEKLEGVLTASFAIFAGIEPLTSERSAGLANLIFNLLGKEAIEKRLGVELDVTETDTAPRPPMREGDLPDPGGSSTGPQDVGETPPPALGPRRVR